MKWIKNEYGSSVSEIVQNKSGLTEEELIRPKNVLSKNIQNMKAAAIMLFRAVKEGKHITVFGDYDVDGISATAILVSLIRFLRGDVSYRLPHRISEGYGISVQAIDEISDGLLITVDNGIAANEAIQAAKDKGLEVLVIDHHLPGEELPPADLIVDPHLEPEQNEYEHYCGAGLSLKLAEIFLNAEKARAKGDAEKEKMLNNLYYRFVSLACIGTIADVMPLTGDNRWIVMQGLKLLSQRNVALPLGLAVLIDKSGLGEKISETDIGFKIAPALNAPGRLEDDGAEKSLNALLATDKEEAVQRCQELLDINEKRKMISKAAVDQAIRMISDNPELSAKAPICLILKNIPEGVVGLVTGQIAEKYHSPAFVFTETEPGVLKGSGRRYGDINLKEIVDHVSDLLIRGGGHAGAAGISVSTEKYDAMVQKMKEFMKDYDPEDSEVLNYDLEVSGNDLPYIYREVQKYAPYGEGNPAPVFLVNTILTPRGNEYYKFLGADQSHLKLMSKNFSVIAFGLAQKFQDIGCPYQVRMIGTLGESSFHFTRELQVEAQDIEAQPEKEKPIIFQHLSKIEKI